MATVAGVSETTGRRPSRWAGLPPEERQRQRRELLIEAAIEALGTEGMAGTTVRSVCAGADLNPRYFYESFDELDELLVAVYDDVLAQLHADIRTRVRETGEDPDAAVRASVEATIRFVDADRRRGQILYVEALGNEALNRRRMTAGFDLVEAVERDAARRRGSPPDSGQIGRIGAAMLVGGFSEVVAAWVEGRIEVDADTLIDDATELFVAVGAIAGDLVQRRAATR